MKLTHKLSLIFLTLLLLFSLIIVLALPALFARITENQMKKEAHTFGLFLLQNIEIADVKSIGRESKHSKIFIKLSDGRVLEAVQWNVTPDQINLAGVNEIVARLKMSEWRGRKKVELVLS